MASPIINTSEYASNSKTKREVTQVEKKKVEKVIQGESITKKKSLGKKFSETFIKEDIGSVKSYILMEVIIPAVTDLISETFHNTIDMMFYGSASSGRRRSGYSGKTNYTTIFKQDPRNNPRDSYRSVVNNKTSIDDVILETRGDAEEVLNCLMDIIEEYKMASVADLNDLIGKSTVFTQNHIGWFDLSNARIERVREGYLLNLPRPTNLD